MQSKYLSFLFVIAPLTAAIEIEILAPSLLDLGRHFHVTEAQTGLTMVYSFMGFCLAALFYGPLSESFGRRKIMVWGNGLLTIGAIACVVAPTFSLLLFFRFLQGLGAATSAVLVSAMIADVYSVKKATYLYGVMNATFALFLAASPLLANFINDQLGWRGNYILLAALYSAAWLAILFLLPETKKEKAPLRLKKTGKDYIELLKSFKFVSASIIPSLLYGSYLAFITCAAFLYIETFGLSVLSYSIHQSFIVAAFVFASFSVGKVIKKWGEIKSILLGLTLYSVSVIAIFIQGIFPIQSPYLITFFVSLLCMGYAILYPIVFAESIEIFPNIKGTASSVIMSIRSLLCAGLVGLVSFLYNGTLVRVAAVLLCLLPIVAILILYLLKTGLFSEKPSK